MSASESHDERADAVEELRALLLGSTGERLGDLEQRLGTRDAVAEEIAEVLPRAIGRRQRPDDELSLALGPSVEQAITRSVRRNPQPLTDAIFPVIGPAIRKAISQAISHLVQGINRSVEATFTPRGLRWRFEAWRTGRSYGEIVLTHSLEYRVEQVYLIHRETGLLLSNVGPLTTPGEGPDVVSGMFTAIQDFVHDAFPQSEQGSLEQARVGDLTLLGEGGPRALLAVIVRGTPPRELRKKMQEALESIHAEWQGELERFDGDSAPFELTEPLLESCLLVSERSQRKSWVGPLVLSLAGAALVAFLIILWIRSGDRKDRHEAYLARLAEEPGLVVLSAHPGDDPFRVRGLRDPLAPDPMSLLDGAGLEEGEVDLSFSPFFAASPEISLKRARRILEVPESVSLRLEDGVLRASGWAPRRWYDEAARHCHLVPGVERLVVEDLGEVGPDRDVALVGRSLVFFVPGDAALPSDEEEPLRRLTEVMARIDRQAHQRGARVRVTVQGRSLPHEAHLSAERAAIVADHLATRTWLATEILSAAPGPAVAAWVQSAEARAGRVAGATLDVETIPPATAHGGEE